ncbi:unnamed protein product [Phytomonas sp. Hart1]|nr:unnamed protein product [Phytomonas sp. Hart1]|eukprot:CCW71554.1 unnamed protein product [Phytomonas sp. isolate Hart1]
MSSPTLYTAHDGFPAYVSASRLRAFTHPDFPRHLFGSSSNDSDGNHLLDVPVGDGEVGHWAKVLQEVAPPSSTISFPAELDPQRGTEGDHAAACSTFQTALGVFGLPSEDARRGAIHKLAPFPAFRPQAVASLAMTAVLKIRRQWLPYRQQFPVYQQCMQLLDAVLAHDVVVVVGGPGSGRTLQLPMILSEKEVFKRRRVVVVSANAMGARLTVARLREERGEAGDTRTVASVLPGHPPEATEGTLLLVTTADVLLRQLLCDPTLMDVAVVVFDDMHLRTEATELCCALLRERASQLAIAEGNAAGGGRGLRRLHVVLNCPDEACSTALVPFFTSSPTCRVTTFLLASSSASPSNSAPPVFYLEETIQWLHKCRTEGSLLCRNPELELAPYVEKVDVVTEVMAATDSDFVNETKCRSYWCHIITQAIWHYNLAETQLQAGDRRGLLAETAPQAHDLSLIVVLTPSLHWARIILEEVRYQLHHLCTAESPERTSRPSVDRFEFHILTEFVTPFEDFLSVARGQRPASSRPSNGDSLPTRAVLFMTPELAQTTLPPVLNIGLLVDCARVSTQSFDIALMCDCWSTEYANSSNLRYRRGVVKKKLASDSADEVAPNCMIIQLIPKMVLHSAQHRRQSADPGQHAVFHLSFQKYLSLYQVLQAREEAISYSKTFSGQQATPLSSNRGVSQQATITAKVVPLISTHFIGVPAALANRYEQLRRVFSVVESYLVAAGHLQLSGGSGLEAKHDNEEPETRSDLLPTAKLRPMGILDISMLLPTPITRLLVFGSMFGCFVEATAAAAVWLVGDVYQAAAENLISTIECLPENKEQRLDDEAECRTLLREARRFFSWNTLNDMVGNFNIYKMWLSLRCDKTDSISEKEEAFLNECKVPKSFLLKILSMQANLHELFDGLFWKTNRVSPADKAEQIALVLAQFPDEVIMSGHFHVCLTAALYPNCARMRRYILGAQDGSQGLFGVLLDSPHPPSPSVGASAIPFLRRLGIFADSSLLSTQWAQEAEQEAAAPSDRPGSEAVLIRAVDRTFLYLSKTIIEPGSASPMAVLEQAVPMLEDAVVLVGGETQERPQAAPSRCRGWSVALTGAWRATKRARPLPPPAQLPPLFIPVQAYDPFSAPTVLLRADSTHRVLLHTTTARWLQGLRGHLQQHLGGLAVWKGWTADRASASAAAVASAWGWWQQRQKNGPQWLHGERQARRSAANGTADHPLRNEDEGRGQLPRLLGFYAFSTRPGVPETVVPPALAATKQKKLATSFNSAPEEASVASYTGKFPSPDVDQIVRMCVKSVATKRTREHEAQLLRDNPDLFIFLDPENEFHEYYLYLLRQAVPDMEVLGDDLEELVEYLTSLERELREELGLPPENPSRVYNVGGNSKDKGANEENGDAAKYVATSHPQEQEVLLHEIPGTEGEEEAYANAFTGLQVETAAVSLRKPAVPTLSSRVKASSGTSARIIPDDPTMADPLNEAKVTQDAMLTTTTTTTATSTTATPGTLLEKLMAMKTSSTTKGADSNLAVAPGDLLRPGSTSVPTNAPESAPGSHNAGGAVVDAPPTTAELMELLTGAGIGGAVLDDYLSPGNGMMPSSVMVNPLKKPPPPLPVKVVNERKPSVLVYPLPDRRYGNVPLMLAKALGETMNIRVGPTTIVGTIGRINVPNKKVETRAISLRKFMCVGKKVYIFKNDRIIDNSDSTVYERQPTRGGRGSGNGRGASRGGWQSNRQFNPDDGEDVDELQMQGHEDQGQEYNYNTSDFVGGTDAELDPTMAGDDYLSFFQDMPQRQELNHPAEPSETDDAEASPRMPAVRIGVFSDSDEEETDESDTSTNSSDSDSGTE